MKLTIVIPSFNEEDYLPSTLDSIKTSASRLRAVSDAEVDILVVDNNSEDNTAAVAQSVGATVVHETLQGIARARNAGADHAEGDVLVFVDADVFLPDTLLETVHAAMSDPACVGGAVDVKYRPNRRFIRFYLRAWRVLSRLTGMAQGATQFCRKSVFVEVGGYDERRGSVRTPISSGHSRGWPSAQATRSGSSRVLASRPPPGVSTSGRFGRSWYGPIPSSSPCSAVVRRSGAGGIRGR